jgi:hypothetical protein
MATAAAPTADRVPLGRGERRLALWLRFFALLFAAGAVSFFLRPEETVADLDRLGQLVGLRALPASEYAVASDFWFALAIANMTTIAACAWLAAADVRGRRVLVYPLIVSKLTSSATGILLFVRWVPAFPFLTIALVDLPIAIILIRALRAAREGA